MREIKFRAWFEGTKNYVPPTAYIAPIFSNIPLEEGFIIEQFTGLKDKNSREIYEGDIFQDQHGQKKLVFWEEISASFRWFFVKDIKLGNPISFSFPWGENFHIEIIGNIHENPDHLK